MKKILSHLNPFQKRSKKSWAKLLLVLLISFGIATMISTSIGDAFPEITEVFAQNQPASVPVTPPPPSGGDAGFFGSLGQGLGTVVSGLATLFIKLLAGILWFVLFWMGDLMDNTFILEGEIGEKLRSVWVIVRNFVNIFFALVLVVAALLSVVGYGDEGGNYAMKKFIPKMALALIAVNFTFLACRVVLDVNNVLTTAIFSIPQSVTNLSDIGPTGTSGVRIFREFRCLSSERNLTQEIQNADKIAKVPGFENVINSLGGVCFADADPTKVELNRDTITLDSSQFTKKDFVWTMATQFQGLHNLNKVSQLTNPDFTGLTVNAIFSIIFAVIYATAYVAMFIILLARMVVLWITIMLSPLAAISIAIPDLLPEDLNIQKKFLDHAFVPAKMAVPISFGYILISQMNIAIDTNSAIVQDKTINLANSGDFAREVSITSLMYGAASVAIIWMGVFAASKDVVGSEFVGKIGDYVKGAGATVAKWPTYLPVIPIGGGGASIQTVMTGVATLKSTLAEQYRRGDEKKANSYLESLGIIPEETRAVLEEIKRSIDTGKISAATLGRISNIQERSQFDKMTREIAANPKWDEEARRAIALRYGVNDFELLKEKSKSTTGMDELFKNTRTAATTGGGGAGTADYSTIDASVGGINEAISNTDLATRLNLMNDEVKNNLGIAAAGGVTSIDMSRSSLNGFMQQLKDSTKLRDQDFRAVIQSSVPQKLAAQDPAIRQAMASDAPLLTRLRSNLLEGAANDNGNLAIRNLYKTITGLDDAKLNQQVTKFSKVDASTGNYDPNKTA